MSAPILFSVHRRNRLPDASPHRENRLAGYVPFKSAPPKLPSKDARHSAFTSTDENAGVSIGTVAKATWTFQSTNEKRWHGHPTAAWTFPFPCPPMKMQAFPSARSPRRPGRQSPAGRVQRCAPHARTTQSPPPPGAARQQGDKSTDENACGISVSTVAGATWTKPVNPEEAGRT